MNRPAPSLTSEMMSRRPLRVGRVAIDRVSRDAVWPGGSERLQPQSLKVLSVLAARSGEVVTREELVQLCWDGRIVGEDVINRSISLLRHFAERAGGFEIETVPRAGYRLVERQASETRRRMRGMAAGAGGIVLAGVAAFLFLQHRPVAADSATLSVTVMPFTADQNDPAERQLATNARNSVVRTLTDSGLSVGSEDGPSQPASDLRIYGEIGRSAQSFTGTVRVEEVGRSAIIMSHQLTADQRQAADLPDQMGANVAAALSWTGPLIHRDEKHPSDSAFVAQLLDQDSNEAKDLWRAFEFEHRNAPNAPGSEIAQYELAMDTGLLMRVLPDAERTADISAARIAGDRVRRLDPGFGDGSVPQCLLYPLVRMRACEDQLRGALARDPQAAFVPHFLSRLMDNVGRTGEAEWLAGAALAQDQYAPSKIAHMIEMYEAVGDSPAAERLYRSGSRLWPTFLFIFRLRSEGIAERGDFDALYRFEQSYRANLPRFYDSALSLAQAVRARSRAGVVADCPRTSIDLKIAECMLGFARIGDLDDAFAYADLVYPQRRGRTPADEERLWLQDSFQLDTALLTGRGAAPMRRDPRYLALAGRLGLLDYWRSGRLPDFCTRAREPVCAQITGRPA